MPEKIIATPIFAVLTTKIKVLKGILESPAVMAINSANPGTGLDNIRPRILKSSMGSILLCGADKGKRFLYPHSRVLIHQPLISGQMVAVAVDIHIQAQEMERLRDELNAILADSSGQPLEKIQKDTDRDFYMTADEAIKYGLADGIVEKI